MKTKFSQNFTLVDIFNNKRLKDRLPIINYKETQMPSGKVSKRTNAKTVNRLIFDTATSAARPYYKPLRAYRTGDILVLDGTLEVEQDTVVDAVYNALMSIKSVISFTANNAEMIRDAIKEGEKKKYKGGVSPKLYLRATSMEQIEGMSKPQIVALMNDIMENIMYGEAFPETQKKYKVQQWKLNTPYTYEERKERWKRKIGEL